MVDKFEKEIISEINSFRDNPKSIQHQIEVLQKGISRLRAKDPFLKEIDDFLRTIDRIPRMKPLSLNNSLYKVAREEVKKYIRNESTYNPYLTGNQLKGIVPSGFLAQNAALIADSGADEAETVVPKLLLNKGDKDKKGRQILCTQEYSQIGIANREFEGENYYVLYFQIMIVMKKVIPNYLMPIYLNLNKLLIYMIMMVLKKLGFKNVLMV